MKKNIKKYYDSYFGINAAYENWAKRQGISTTALFILSVINEFPIQTTQRFICEKLLFPKQTVNSTLDLLEKKGYIQRTVANNDKRNKFIVFTSEGQKYADSILAKLSYFEESALGGMESNMREGMIEGNMALLEQLNKLLNNESESGDC